jgi:SAM-dependent methyltransferase
MALSATCVSIVRRGTRLATADPIDSEYSDPEEYDQENGLDGPALPFYGALARETGGPGLDLACGTGFLTIPLAAAGLAMTGVDRSPVMLDHARHKSAHLAIRWLLADCRTLDLGEVFRFITMTGNAFQEFLTRADQEGLLGTVRRHLAPDGLFAFETRYPRNSSLLDLTAPDGEWTPEVPWRTFADEQGRTIRVSTTQRNNSLRQTVNYAVHRRWHEAGEERVKTEYTTLRFVYPQEMEALLHYNGLAIRDAYGDWDRQPLTATSPRMIFVCQPRP